MPNHISSNMSDKEILRTFGDQIPEFMLTWVEALVDKAEDADAFWGVLYNQKIELVDDNPENLSTYIDSLTDKVENLEDELTNIKGS